MFAGTDTIEQNCREKYNQEIFPVSLKDSLKNENGEKNMIDLLGHVVIHYFILLQQHTLTEGFPCFFLSCKANSRV
jgi:hypothetical protein